MNNQVKVTVDEFKQMIESMKGTRIVSFVSTTVPKMRKTGNPLVNRGIRKIAFVNGIIGSWNYTNAVQNRRDKEGQPIDNDGNVEQFEAKPRQWGQRMVVNGKPIGLVEHTTKEGEKRHYLEVYVGKSLGYEYRDDAGNLVNKDEVNKWLPDREEGARQEVENPVILRDYNLNNITDLVVNNTAIKIDGEPVEA